MLYIVTYATHSERYFETLKKSCPDIIVLGYGEKWNGFIDKTNGIIEFCNNKNPSDIICVVDGFDSVVLDSDIIEERYRELGKDLVFSKEGSVCSVVSKYFMDKVFSSCKSTKHRISAGLYIGTVQSIVNFWKDYHEGDDQEYVTERCDEVYVDINNNIFYNYTPVDRLDVREGRLYLEEGSRSIPIIGSPGNRDMRPILRKLGYNSLLDIQQNNYLLSGIPKYGKLFLPEIIWAIVSILLFLGVPNKKLALVVSFVILLEVINFEVDVKHKKASVLEKILYTAYDAMYICSVVVILWIMIHSKNLRNIAILDILAFSIMALPIISLDTRIKYWFHKDINYLDKDNIFDDNKILILVVLSINLWKLRNI